MSPIPYEFHLLCVLFFVSSLGWLFFFFQHIELCSLIDRAELSSSHFTQQVFFERAQTCVPDKLDLSLCTVGTSSAFLQTADNICLLTCTVTCRTLLTLQIIPPPNPPSSALSHPTKLPENLEHKPGPFTSGCQ